MSIKLFHELERAAASEDQEALAIFRALSKQLRDGGLSWTDVPERLTGTPYAPAKKSEQITPTTRRTTEARENIGPVLLQLRAKFKFQDRSDPNVAPNAWRWRDVESRWLNEGKLSASQMRDVAEATEIKNLNDYVGRANPEWTAQHKRTIDKLKDEENQQVRNALIELQSARSDMVANARKAMADFATAANGDRRRMVCWGTAVEIIAGAGPKLDMQALLAATLQSGETPESMALCLLLDISPAKLNIGTPSLSTARQWLSQDNCRSMPKFIEKYAHSAYDVAFEKHKTNARLAACISTLAELDSN